LVGEKPTSLLISLSEKGFGGNFLSVFCLDVFFFLLCVFIKKVVLIYIILTRYTCVQLHIIINLININFCSFNCRKSNKLFKHVLLYNIVLITIVSNFLFYERVILLLVVFKLWIITSIKESVAVRWFCHGRIWLIF